MFRLRLVSCIINSQASPGCMIACRTKPVYNEHDIWWRICAKAPHSSPAAQSRLESIYTEPCIMRGHVRQMWC
ncbi:hypothetical protein IAQ61_008637 [Plenodomus lingam]|uniref:uncharacterized protein n=1 Tax=Leptosphaeria maculans TaxID=5022 RepID=UPI00331B1116|nr:hypothetical protein IAQ61_008637 [Plenodomus lingam]